MSSPGKILEVDISIYKMFLEIDLWGKLFDVYQYCGINMGKFYSYM